MEEAQGLTEGHPLQGPHRDRGPHMPAGFAPLRLLLEPVGIAIEVHRPEAIIGRHSAAEIRLALPDISRRHCRLFFENQQWRVADLNSLNGVFVNGERMQEATLYHGDHLQIGTFNFLVEHQIASATRRDDKPRVEILHNIVDAIKEQKWAS
jgi:pSer/pThr/pTyr-binding forkhead associated (FHA) protein